MNKKNVTVLGYNLEIFVGVVGRQVDGKKSEAPKWYKLGAFGHQPVSCQDHHRACGKEVAALSHSGCQYL